MCKDVECDWYKNFWAYKKAGKPGLLLHGVSRPDTRCQLIAAALIRNFIDARVIPVNTLLDLRKEGTLPVPTVLLIPNFYLEVLNRSTPAWQLQALYDILLNRAIRSKPTVIYVENLDKLAKVYGAPFRDFLDQFIVAAE